MMVKVPSNFHLFCVDFKTEVQRGFKIFYKYQININMGHVFKDTETGLFISWIMLVKIGSPKANLVSPITY